MADLDNMADNHEEIQAILQQRNITHLSASSIDTYLNCGRKYRHTRIDGIKGPTTESLQIGTDFHRWCEIYVGGNGAIGFDDFMPTEGAEFIIKRAMSDMRLLLDPLKEEAKNGSKITCEMPFEIMIEGVDVPIIGFIDLVVERPDGSVLVIDYKTANRDWSKNKHLDKIQPAIYTMAMMDKGYERRDIEFMFIIVTKSTGNVESRYVRIRQNNLDAVTTQIQQVWKGISNDVFIPQFMNNYLCSSQYCPVWKLCKGNKLPMLDSYETTPTD